MSAEDSDYTALGPTGVGFKTFGANIAIGGEFIGTQTGIIAGCNSGPAIQATGNVNDEPAVKAINGAPRGSGLTAGGGAQAEGVFATGGTNGVHGFTNSSNDIGVWGQNNGGGYGVSGSSNGVGVIGGLPGSKGLDNHKPNASVGVWGTTVTIGLVADSGDGVLGEGQNGVHGRSRSQSDSGVWGENTNGGFGVAGTTTGDSGPKGTVAGVWGSNFGAGAGVRGTSKGGAGLLGEGPTGVSGQGGIGVLGRSAETSAFTPSPGVWGLQTAGGVGVLGGASGGTGSIGVLGNGGYGGVFEGNQAPLRLIPSTSAGQPTIGEHLVGEFYVDSTGALFYCRTTGTPGVWVKLA
jgi:hypothetical protein